MNKGHRQILVILSLAAAAVWLSVFTHPDSRLHLIACDVGQGDAMLAIYGEVQILIDGGPDEKVLACLGEYMPFWDREIELVVLTHPQVDHFGGLIEVFRRYQVDYLLANKLDSSSQKYKVLKNAVGGSQAQVISPNRGMSIRYGLLHLDISHPNKEFISRNSQPVSGVEDIHVLGVNVSNRNLNDFSIVATLSLGTFDALLTGDIGPEVIDEVLDSSEINEVEYLKIPHHGSKNGLTQDLLAAAQPRLAVISVGAKNRYGHPHQSVLAMLREAGVTVYRTDQVGSVELVTDGRQYWVKR